MARLVPILLALFALVVPAAAFANPVNINDGGYVDSNTSTAKTVISPGGSVVWHYANSTAHGVQFGSQTETCAKTTQLLALGMDCGPVQFDTPGRYTYHDVGCNAGDAGCITGQVVVYVPPTSSFTSSTTSQQRGQPINFDGNGSTAPGGSISAYNWDFGDGTSATGAATYHAYTAAGSFTVKLTVTDDQGNVAVSQQDVTITVPDADGDGVNDDLDKCAANAGPAPDGCPITPYVLPGPIASSATAAGDLSPNALKTGIRVVLNCSDACTGVFTLTRAVNSAAATPQIVAIPQTVTLAQAGSRVVTLRFTSAAKKSLKKAKNPKLLLTVAVTDSLARKSTLKKSIVLRKVKTYGKLPAIGISDNNASTFLDPNFQVLHLRYARLVSPWNAIFTEPDRLDAWLQTARINGVRPLVSFEHERGQICPGRKCKGPSKGQFTKAWKAFHKKYPWVKDVSPWNEVNSATQPTGKKPELAATYYNVVRASCRGCTIVAADLLDSSNIRRYSAAFLKKAKGKPKLWGLHNYTDTNRFRSRGTTALLQSVKGTVWLTETGGVVKFVTQKGVVALPQSESRARKAIDYMFRLAEKNAKRIKRIYVYQWKVNNSFDRFDAGIVRADGTPRPSFDVLTRNASLR